MTDEMIQGETYLGDGVYASCDAFGTIKLRVGRADGDHYVYLTPETMKELTWYAGKFTSTDTKEVVRIQE